MDVDIVITWVDGADPAWLAEKQACSEQFAGRFADFESTLVVTGNDEINSAIRYRDWGTLPYLFRGIERFAPWARKIHFVTWGHVPEWLDTSNPRLNLVRHSDFIPAEYLPTFASPPIELNVNHIEGLAERFVLFNDDMFLLRGVPMERFFKNGLPCDMARLTFVTASSVNHAVLNITEILNRRHNRRRVMRRDFCKWYSPKYGLRNLLRTRILALWELFAGVVNSHMPQPHLRSTFERMWEQEHDILDATCRAHFRTPLGVNHWLMRYEQLATGQFSPVSMRDVKLDSLTETRIDDIESYIRDQKYSMVCLNDSPLLEDFEGVRDKLIAAFEAILPEKSSYEK